MNDFISNIITEASLDARIPNGLVDLNNADHIQVIAEILYDACQDENLVNEFVSEFIKEGKYPERQAYNKDGWLVTFPSKEYRDAAIKKKTHYSSDPTHGKGGMNLYYKKKGKQKRQTQQTTTAVQPPTEPQKAEPKAPQTTQPSAPSKDTQVQPQADKSSRADRLAKITGSDAPTTPKAPEPKAAQTQAAPQAAAPSAPTSAPEKSPTPSAPAIDVPVVTTPPEQYASISKKFAVKKGWFSEPYGEYRDGEGNPVAVVGLSGEVVPIRSNDREEYKLFAEKSMT